MRKRGRVIAFPIAVVAPIILSSLGLDYKGSLLIGVGIFAGYEIGKYIDPDWDLVTATNSESRMINELPLIGYYLFGVSSMYGAIFRRMHRSFWTHFPAVSTAIRHFFVFGGLGWEIYWSTLDWSWLIFIYIGIFVGNSFSDAIHWFLDMIKYPKSE